MRSTDLLVSRADLAGTSLVTRDLDPLAPGEVLLRVDTFGLSANNITYALAGDLLGYWRFFPAPEGWGRIPVWGFADVVESRHEAVPAGTRVFGYLPMSTHLVVKAEPNATGFVDASEHRRALPPFYNRYGRVPARSREDEAPDMLLRPFVMTGVLLDGYLADQGFAGAETVILVSASSKTAIGLAYVLGRRGAPGVVGLTSARNRAFVERLGLYRSVATYDDLAGLDGPGRVVLVDFAGDPALRLALHGRLGERLAASVIVGSTHAKPRGGDEPPLPGPAPVVFFGPTQLEKMRAALGPEGFQAHVAATWQAFLPGARSWLRVREGRGPAAVEETYRALLANRGDPADGHVLSMHPAP